MTYLNTWHPEYAAESLKRHENHHNDNADRAWTEYAVECGQVAELAATLGDAKTVSIAQTVISTINDSHKLGKRSHRKVTPKQRYALAKALLAKYGTARAIAAAAWGLSDEDIDNADV